MPLFRYGMKKKYITQYLAEFAFKRYYNIKDERLHHFLLIASQVAVTQSHPGNFMSKSKMNYKNVRTHKTLLKFQAQLVFQQFQQSKLTCFPKTIMSTPTIFPVCSTEGMLL